MVKEFLEVLTFVQAFTLLYVVMYGIVWGIRYHLTVLVAVITCRGNTTDNLTAVLNWTWYSSIAYLIYCFV